MFDSFYSLKNIKKIFFRRLPIKQFILLLSILLTYLNYLLKLLKIINFFHSKIFILKQLNKGQH